MSNKKSFLAFPSFVTHQNENQSRSYSGLQETCRPGVSYFPLFPFLFCTRTVQSGFVPHVTFLVQKLLGEMEKVESRKLRGDTFPATPCTIHWRQLSASPFIRIKTTTLRINIDGGVVTSYIFTFTHLPLTLSNLSSPILWPLLRSPFPHST